MFNWLLKLVTKFLKHHGYLVISNEDYNNYKELYDKACSEEQRLFRENERLTTRLSNVELMDKEKLDAENHRLQTEHDRIYAEIKESNEYYEKVQKDLRKALHNDTSFTFAKSMCFPGSSSVSCETVQEEHNTPIQFVVMCGRTTMDDEATAKLKQFVGIDQKYAYCLNYLMKLGLIDKIAKNLINGGLTITLSYNDDCTVNEIYYEAKCMIPDNGHLIIK